MEGNISFFIIVLFILTLIGYFKFGNIINPVTLFCGIWTVILFTYSLHLFGLYYASDEVILSITIGVLMFFLGAMFKSSSVGNRVFEEKLFAIQDKPNYKLMTYINLISIIILLGYATVTIRMLLSGVSYEYIHVMYQSEEGVVGSLKSGIRLWHYFVWPWNLATIPMVVVCFMFDKDGGKEQKIFHITTLINIGTYILISGARVSLAYFAFYFLVILRFQKKKIHLGAWQKVLIIVVGLTAWTVFAMLSESRNSASLENTAYTYLCGCVPFFSYRLDVFQATGGQYMYGLHTFSGFLKPVFAVLGKIFGSSEMWTRVLSDMETQGRTYIAPHNPFNAFSSLFYYFYMDGGLLSVGIFSFIYGFFSLGMYCKFMRKKTYKNLVLYLLTAFGLAFSMVRFHFTTLRYILSFFYVMISFSKFQDFFKSDKR